MQFKNFDVQAFLNDLYNSDLSRATLIPEAELACYDFHSAFLAISKKQVPIKKFRVISRENPWFSESLSELSHLRNKYWAQARFRNASADWIKFKILRNKCNSMIRKSKSVFNLRSVTENLNNPSKFWKIIKSLSNTSAISSLLDNILVDSVELKDKAVIVNQFNKHFISAGSMSDSIYVNASDPWSSSL